MELEDKIIKLLLNSSRALSAQEISEALADDVFSVIPVLNKNKRGRIHMKVVALMDGEEPNSTYYYVI